MSWLQKEDKGSPLTQRILSTDKDLVFQMLCAHGAGIYNHRSSEVTCRSRFSSCMGQECDTPSTFGQDVLGREEAEEEWEAGRQRRCSVREGREREGDGEGGPNRRRRTITAVQPLTCSACESWVSRWQSIRHRLGSRPSPSHGRVWNAPFAPKGQLERLQNKQKTTRHSWK